MGSSVTLAVPVVVNTRGAISPDLTPYDAEFRQACVGGGTSEDDEAVIDGSGDGSHWDHVLTVRGGSQGRWVFDDRSKFYSVRRTKGAAALSLVVMMGNDPGGEGPDAWTQGGNSFGATGVLGTLDANHLTLVAEGATILDSDGVETGIGNAGGANNVTLLAGSGDVQIVVSNGGAIQMEAEGPILAASGTSVGVSAVDGIALSAGAGGIDATATGAGNLTFRPGASGAVRLPPRAAGAGNTTPLRFLELAVNGVSSVGLKAADALAADVTWTLPATDATLANKALLSDGAGVLSWGNAIQSGAATLTNGVSPAIAANISASSRIFIQAADVVPGAGNLTIGYRPLAADRVNGTPGSFKITAVVAAGTSNALDQSVGVQWMVLNA